MSTREQAIERALYAILQRCSAAAPNDTDYSRWHRQSAASIGELLNDARAALALPPSPEPQPSPVAAGERWEIAAGDKRYVRVHNVAKPINAGRLSRAQSVAFVAFSAAIAAAFFLSL